MVDPPMLIAYCEWLDEYQCAAPGTIKLRSYSIRQFLHWLASHTPPLDFSKLTPDVVERFVLFYAKHKGHAARRSMQAALRDYLSGLPEPAPDTRVRRVDPETEEALRGLGYLE